MMTRSLAPAAPVLAVISPPSARADDHPAGAPQQVAKEQIAAFNHKDVGATMGYAHTKSPSYDEAKTELTSAFSGLDPKAEQVSFQYIGHDDEFALARVKVKVTATGAEGFQDNVVDTITIFHQEGGKWKVWDAYLVGGQLAK